MIISFQGPRRLRQVLDPNISHNMEVRILNFSMFGPKSYLTLDPSLAALHQYLNAFYHTNNK
jgi:hypothetical protein